MMVTAIQKWGNSQGVRIPKSFLDAVGISVNDPVEVVRSRDDIIIRKVAEKQLTLEEIFSGYNDSYRPSEPDFFGSVGKEVW